MELWSKEQETEEVKTTYQVFWDQWGQSPDDGALLYTQDSTGTILELAVSAEGVTLQGQLLLEPLQKAIEGYCKTAVSSVELVGYDKGHLLLLVNADTLCAAEIRDNVCLPCCWLPLPSQGPKALTFTFQVAAGMVGVVHSQAQLLIIYHLSDGQLVCQIDLEPAGFNQSPSEGETETSEGERETTGGEREKTTEGERERSEGETETSKGETETSVPQREKTTTEGERRLTAASSVTPWSLSPALDRLVWLDSQGALVSLHLETYIRRHPHVLRLPERNSPPSSRTRVTHTVQSCRLGGKSSWREKLVQGHLQQGSGSSLWSSAKLALTLADLKRADGRGVAASAFRKQGEEEGVGEGYRECVRLPEGYPLELGYAVREMRCGGVVVTMVMEDGVNRTTAVGMVNVVTGEVYFRSIPGDHCPIATPTGGLPIMLLSPGGVLLLAPTGDTHHEDIVSKLMQHSGAPRTDSVCQLNGWSHSTVPLTALEQGLRQHQLDTVAFFLASQQHIFSGHGRNTAPSTPSQTWTEGAHLFSMRQLSPALDLFLKVIHGDLADMSPPQEFGERLLRQMLEFLFDLLKDGSVRHGQLTRKDAHRAESLDLDFALEVAMGYIGRLRAAQSADQSQKRRAALRPSTSVSADKESLDAVSVDTVDADPGEVTVYTEDDVERACGGNDLPSMQSRLLVHHDHHHDDHWRHARWGEVVRVGVRRAWIHIQRRDLTSAQTLLASLGLDVCRTIWRLSQYTTDREFQLFVVHQLHTASTLGSQDQRLVEDLQKLYSVYPAASVHHGNCRGPWSHSALTGQTRTVSTRVSSGVKDIASTTPTPAPAPAEGPYCVVALHWLRQMEEEMKEALLLDGAVLRKEATEERGFTPRLLWRYWLGRNQPGPAIRALEVAMATERGMLGTLLDQYLRDLRLASAITQHQVQTHLLRKRVYRWEILHSLDASPEDQLRLLEGLLHTPHPLHGYAHAVLRCFHRQFAAYCAQHGLVLALWQYCSLHGVDVEALRDLPCAEDVPWFKSFLCLHSAVNQPNNLEAMCGGSLLLASVRWTPDDWTLSTLLAQGHVTTAAATVAYLPHTCALTQAGEGPQYHVDVPTLHSGLQRFPKLLSALLPPDADTSRFDINVYQLLRDNCPLHSTRLFGWQSTNTAAAEDGVKVLPYFSQPDLVSRFAHGTKLNLTYYLKHGRPTYALLSFLAEELEHKTSTLSPKRVAGACGVALWLCVKHFHRAPVSGACVALVEMLGRDSTLLRTYLQAGEAILTHRTRRLSAPVERRKEMVKACEQDVVTLLQSCLGNRQRDGRRLLSALEDAITDEIAREGLSCTSVEAALKWNVAMLLCHHLRLPLSSRFLENAAHDDKWLPFLWFAQLHQFPKAQLQQVVHHFSARHLRDHLHYIITNAGANTVTTATPTPEARPPGPKATTNTTADGSRQIRSALYFKIGLHAPDDADEESSEEGVEEEEDGGGRGRRDSDDPLKSSSRRSSEDDIEVREESTASDVFRVVFSALATSQPWRSLLMHAVVLRNPLFAELAGCCGAPMVSSLCAWLVAMLSPTEHTRFVEHDGKRAWCWSEKHLEKLMETYLRCHAENTLTAAFFIFQPTSPLLPFLQFIRECVFWRNYEGCKAFLDNFKDAMSAISAATSKPSREKGSGGVNKGEQSGVSVVGDRDWLERVAYRVVHHQLVHAPSLHDAWRMLGLLAEENIALVFSFDVLDFGHLHKMLGVLHRCQVGEGLHLPHLLADQGLHLPHLLADQGPHQHLRLAQCGRALQSLVAQGYQEDAYLFGQLAGLDLSGVVLKQISSEKQQLQGSGVWGSGVIRQRYWTQCAATCHRFYLPAATVAGFFQSEAEDRESLREKTSLYKLSLIHVEGVLGREVTGSDDLRTLRDRTFTALWRCTVQDRVARHRTVQQLGSDKEGEGGDMFSDLEEGGSVSRSLGGREELLHTALHPQAKVCPEDELNSEEAMELESMMGDLLAEGHVTQCCDLATLLGGHCEDLTIVLTCIGLSTGEITVATMDAASRLLLTTAERRKSLKSLVTIAPSPSSVSLASAAHNWGFLPPGQEEIIFTLEQLLSRCHKCRPCCLRIISVYKIACLIGRSYQEVVMAEEFSILRELLKTEFPPRYTLAAEFLSTSSLSDHEVAAFLVEEIVKSLHIYLGGKDGFEGESSSGRSGSGELIFRPTEGGQVFSQLVSLCADPAVLGHRLLQALATMADQSEQPTQEVLSMESELLIMAHECHTAACNMEGISNVLRAARVCAQCLAGASQYHLMMRLLTGIGRYSEMTYIFDYLQQHHQFEMLLRKGIDKEDKLKTAILDYLKRFHSDDKDTYSMVALNFSMYREIADMLDESGHRNLALLRDKPLDSNRETQDTLKKCIQYFGDAAESYAKDKCYMNTQKCLRWARLVNLQLHLLGSGVKVINLTPEEVKAFVASHPSFLEAYVVTEAYGRAVDWSDSLFNHVLMSADMRYLQDFRTYVKLTPSLIENTLYKLRHSPGKLTSCVGVVRKMLKLCPDVWLQYSIARDLGLQDVTRDLLRNDTCSSYLKDLISQQ
ncbi:hypothetical protein ACOMHN_035875 [Nucella lapillus]